MKEKGGRLKARKELGRQQISKSQGITAEISLQASMRNEKRHHAHTHIGDQKIGTFSKTRRRPQPLLNRVFINAEHQAPGSYRGSLWHGFEASRGSVRNPRGNWAKWPMAPAQQAEQVKVATLPKP